MWIKKLEWMVGDLMGIVRLLMPDRGLGEWEQSRHLEKEKARCEEDMRVKEQKLKAEEEARTVDQRVAARKAKLKKDKVKAEVVRVKQVEEVGRVAT